MQIFDKRSYNAIIFQPTIECAWNCTGCYLKKYEKHNKVQEQEVPEWMAEVASRILEGKEIKCNQVTFSLNHPSNIHNPLDNSLYRFILHVMKEARRIGRDNTPEIHFTMGEMSLSTYDNWGLLWDIYQTADVVSISVDNFKSKSISAGVSNYKQKEVTASFNCNLLMTPQVIKEAKGFLEPRYFIHNILCNFDTVYMVAHKPVLDMDYSKLHADSVRGTIELYNSLPAEMKKRVFIDKCVETCAKSKYYCEAGTNMMTVWPDGRIIGCPYSTHGGTKPQDNTPDQIIKSMLAMRKYAGDEDGSRHYFNRCKMRDLWNRK